MNKWYLFGLLAVMLFSNCKKEDQAKIDRDIILQYIEDNNLDDMVEDPSGLFYDIEVEGTGSHPIITDKVKVKYTGYLLDGTIFDQTEPGEVRTFQLAGLIGGWQIGIQKMKKDGEAKFLVPSGLAYGSNPPPGIPRNAVLVFDLTLVGIQ